MTKILDDTKRHNFEILQSYLDGLPVDDRFDMGTYYTKVEENYIVCRSNPPACGSSACGSSACAIGYGPAAGIAPLPGETWTAYSYRCFIEYGDAWNWCFTDNWVEVDNTAKGAAFRIRHYLNHGVPEWFINRHKDLLPWIELYNELRKESDLKGER